MTPEIKKRIEQIQRGEVPEGYKKTRAGIIPAEWQEKDLSDVLKKQTKKNADNSVNNVLTNSATRGIIRQTEYFDKQIANDENKEGYYIVKPGYFVYNPRISVGAPCGPFNKYYGETTGIMSPLYTVYKYADDSQYYSEFLSYYFNSSYWHKYMYGIANYGARSDRMNVTSDDMGSLPLPYPSLPEQKKIAEILAAQDRVIELYQRKIDEIKKLKKICLSKMFPQKGHNAPEIRFPEFTDAWEQRKLGEIFEEYSEKNREELPALMIVQGGGTIRREESDRNLLYDKANLSNYKMVKEGDFIVHLRSFEGGLEKATNTGIISPAYHTFHGENTDSRFYYSYFRSKKFIDIDLKPHVYGIRDGRSIDIKGMKTIKIPFTSYEEQKAIGTFIEHLDNLITLHQRKLEELQRHKKALMQLLLTGIVRVNV